MTDLHNLIDKRTNDNFFGIQSQTILAPLKPVSVVTRSSPSPRIKTLSLDNLDIEKFKWDKLLQNKVPRNYQLLSFIDSLLKDAILVLPTGSGKTTVSSMLLARMSKENPGTYNIQQIFQKLFPVHTLQNRSVPCRQIHHHCYVRIFCTNVVSAAFSSYILALAKNLYKNARKKCWWSCKLKHQGCIQAEIDLTNWF